MKAIEILPVALILPALLLLQGAGDHEKHDHGDHGHADHEKAESQSAHSLSAKDTPDGPNGPALELAGKRYGHGVTLAEATSIEELFSDPDRYAGKRVRVEGKVTEVCKKAGCWVNLQAEEGGRPITFKVADGVIVFPVSAEGKRAIAEGVVSKMELSIEQTRGYLGHLAEERGETFDATSVKEPMTLVRVKGTGAQIY